MRASTTQRLVRGIGIALFLVVLGLVVWYGDQEGLSLDTLRAWVDAAGLWGPVVYVVVAVTASVFLVPGTAVMVLGALLFPLALALPIVWAGAVGGSVACFVLARWLGRGTVARLLRGRLSAWDARLRDQGFKVMFVLRIAGLPPFNLLNYLAGLTNVRLRDATAATALGILPTVLVVVVLVDRIGTAPTPRAVAGDPVFWGALVVVAVLALLPRLLRRRIVPVADPAVEASDEAGATEPAAAWD